MKFTYLQSTGQGQSKNTIFIYFGKVFQKLRQFNCNLTTFDMGAYQIWSYHVTQVKNLSSLYLKSYSPLNFEKSNQICGSAASLTEVINKTI